MVRQTPTQSYEQAREKILSTYTEVEAKAQAKVTQLESEISRHASGQKVK